MTNANHTAREHDRQLSPGVRASERNTDPWWASNARQAIETLAATRLPFTADDLRDGFGLAEPSHPNHWGAAFAAARRDGLIKPTGRIAVSRRHSRAGGLVREWVGVREQLGKAA